MMRKLLFPKRHRIIDVSDEYINWLCFANAGMLERGNLYCFDLAISNITGDAPILEIGTFCGLSTNIITYYKQQNGLKNRLITVDRWEFEGAAKGGTLGASQITHEAYANFVKETFIRNVRMFSGDDLPYAIEMLSDEFFSYWEKGAEVVDIFSRSIGLGGPVSFCYIDGNHSYEYALRDFENCDRWLLPGGFILFDDSSDRSGFEVTRVAKEVHRSKRYDTVAKNPNYLFQKK